MDTYVKGIKALDQAAMDHVNQRLNHIAKPIGSLGLLESLLIKLAGITAETTFDFHKKALVIMCADNGVVAEGISQSTQEITAVVTQNFIKGMASVNQFAAVAGVDVFPVDIGISTPYDNRGVIDKKVSYGTANLRRKPAMTDEEATKAILTGIDMVKELKDQGYSMIATGEMGIGNTTTSSALVSVLLDLPVEMVTGKGAGLSDEGVQHKIQVIKDAIGLHQPDKADGFGLLCKLGGLDIAGMVGLYIGGAYYRVPVIIDGIISGIAAMIAESIAPSVKPYLIASHMSKEPSSKYILEYLELKPLLSCEMGLGEGTGAVGMMPLVDMILGVYRNMPTFEELSLEKYEEFDTEE